MAFKFLYSHYFVFLQYFLSLKIGKPCDNKAYITYIPSYIPRQSTRALRSVS